MSGSTIFDMAICTIFAREFMEGAIIIGEFRTAIIRSPDSKDEDAPSKERLLKTVNWSAFWASVCAVLVIVIVAIPLAVLSKNFSEEAVEIIEGVSKVVAAIAILLLSLKIPKWLGFYKNKKKGKVQEGFDLSIKSVRFNVAWNIWREIAECGAFLLPSFLQGDDLLKIPLSAFVGIVVGLAVGFLIYWANRAFKQKLPLTIFITLLLVFLATGLFVGGCHEFEEVWGETNDVWVISNPAASHKQLPMVLFKPFGYSSSRTVLQITCFWLWLVLSGALHMYMIYRTQKINEELEALAALEGEKPEGDVNDVEKTGEISTLSKMETGASSVHGSTVNATACDNSSEEGESEPEVIDC